MIAFTGRELFQLDLPFRTTELIDFLRAKPFIYILLTNLIWINFWWGIINLLPVMPLDGGQITEIYVRPPSRVYFIGMIVATAMALFGFLMMGSIYIALLFGYFAWKNWQGMKAVGG